MSLYLLLNRVSVQNANAIAGFTWGFPAITHFLGFSHNLNRKLTKNATYKDKGITLVGCAVIVHQHHVHSYKESGVIRFSQNKTPHYIKDTAASKLTETPSVIEEGKMNMTVSLLICLDGYLGNLQDNFLDWILKISMGQRLAGGSILNICKVELVDIVDANNLKNLKHKLLPGFVLQDCSDYLEQHFKKLKSINPDTELLDAWLDFCSIKQKARPTSNLISLHLEQFRDESDNSLFNSWMDHKAEPYDVANIPEEIRKYFSSLNVGLNEPLIKQWQDYCAPTENTSADWEYVPKPGKGGYLVPIMTGYKALTDVYKNKEVVGTRDSETDVCFVEAVHSIGEWQSVHHLKTTKDLRKTIWQYAPYENDWYLCKQGLACESPIQKNNFNDYE